MNKTDLWFVTIWEMGEDGTAGRTKFETYYDPAEVMIRIEDLLENGILFDVYRAECVIDRS